jgi:DNA polymerase III delta prime subunit
LGTYLLKTAEKELGINVFKAEKFSEAGAGLLNKYRQQRLQEELKPVKAEGMPDVEQHTEDIPARLKIKEQESVKDLNTLQEEADIGKATENIIRKRINDYNANARLSHNLKIKAEKLVPDEAGQEAISLARDSKDYSKLTPEQLKANDLYTKGYKEFYERGKKAGVIKGFIEDYIPHVVDFEKSGIKNPADALRAFVESGGSRTEGVSAKSRFGKERKYETFEELEAALKDSGMVVKTKNAAEIWKQYSSSMEKAILNKEMLESLKGMQDVEGYPVAMKITEKTPMPREWVTFPQMPGYAFHPDMKLPMQFVFNNTNPGLIMKGLNAVSQAAKRANVVGSLFHAKSLAEAFLLSDPVRFAKELATGFAGTKAALRVLREGGLGDNVDMLLREGLVIETPEDVTRGILSDIGRGADWVLNRYGPTKDIKIGESTLRKVEDITLKPFDKLTWDFAATGFKTLVALKKLEEAKLAHPEVDPKLLAREIASYANNTFGSLNWFEVGARTNNKILKELANTAFNPTGRRNLQLLMFAPDWTVSTLRAFTTMFNKGTGLKGLIKPKLEADFARQYQLRNAMIYATVLNGINNITSGHDIWENKDPTRIEFRDGTSMQLAKHSMEAIHWSMDPLKTVTNKIGFIPRAAIIATTGTVPGLGPLKDKSLAGKAAAIAKTAVPFQVQSAMTAPTGEEAKRAILGTLGLPVYGKKKE